MSYVVLRALDQTIGFRTDEGCWTTKHPDAKLYEDLDEAKTIVKKHDESLRTHWDDGTPVPEDVRQRWTAWIEEVIDEAEFRAREDTW